MTSIGQHYHYSVYGQRLCTPLRLVELPVGNFPSPDIRFAHSWGPDLTERFQRLELIDHRPTNLGCDISVHRTNEGYLLDWEGLCRFHVSARGDEIIGSSHGDLGYNWITATLYGMVLAFALHIKGVRNLHASAVVVPGGAVGFLADPGGGKSSLAAAFAARGNPFLTDDVLALRQEDEGYVAYPGFPFTSLSEEAVSALLPEGQAPRQYLNDEKGRVLVDGQWASFSREPAPLQGLFSIARRDDVSEVRLERLPMVQAVQCLMENTNVLPLLPKEYKQTQLAFVSRLASQVPVWRLTYPTGFEHLASVIDQVETLAAEPVGL